jgi:hypothetical protein
MRLLLAAVLFGGCYSSRALARDSLGCEQKAERLSQLGEGQAAWDARQCANSLDVSSRLTQEKHSSWFWYDVTLQ